ncbi:DUF924 family protein [Dyella nitratireducens]|uniref:DUF924 domain-containing protein n=1 Tax=Dyella nitratireducens TaxID=1849580 RepID=A0ABQ1GUQ3_9GAMM|nr:DUF924 family protein [Dyella nitratireducens]GGA50471.1 hypothetical protein GCM10010981_44780 [Dyella nitratireducens]GLQ42593.1 hypothetical protein GCM10007902_24430 [Dyella nitratireducens]
MPTPPSEALAVLAFWFDAAHHDAWFKSNRVFDTAIRTRFAGTVQRAMHDELKHWAGTPQGWLALLIVLDQFPRNLHRHDARACAQDLHAQRLALWGIEEGFDRQLPPIQRVFAYMPLEHAEDITLQQRCVTLFEALCQSLPAEQREHYTGFLDYARRHAAVIARFGRFPHRNAWLGRVSTPEEQAYLAKPGAGF